MSSCYSEKGVTEMSLVEAEKQVPVFEKPKLSSIIREFIGKFKVGKFTLHNKHDDSFCVLGALGFAGGMSRDDLGKHNYRGVQRIYPELNNIVNIDGKEIRLLNKLFIMNDTGRPWSSIADKLEEIGY